MKYLILLMFLSGCSRLLNKEDIDRANCICQKDQKVDMKIVERSNDRLLFECENNYSYSISDYSYYNGCTK